MDENKTNGLQTDTQAEPVAEQPATVQDKAADSGNKCPNCNADLKEGAQFCSSCGYSTANGPAKIYCAKCGTQLETNERFCHICGTPTVLQGAPVGMAADPNAAVQMYNQQLQKAQKVKVKREPLIFKPVSLWHMLSVALMAVLTALAFGDFVSADKTISPTYIPYVIIMSVATILTLVLWNRNKWSRLVAVAAMVILPTAGDILVFGINQYMVNVLTVNVTLIFAAAFVLLVSFGVMRNKKLVVGLFVALAALTLLLSFVLMYVLGIGFVLGLLRYAVLLLALCFTDKENKEVSWKKGLLARAVALVLVVASVATSTIITYNKNWVRVPDMVNMSIEEAEAEADRLTIKKKYDYSEDVEVDHVIRQSTEAGSVVRPEHMCTLVLSKGPGVLIPEGLSGKSQKEATKILEDLGLTVKVQKDYSSKIDKGDTIRVEEYHVDEGATVHLVISKGKDTRINIPNVVGETKDAAVSKLEKKGFKVKVKYTDESAPAYHKEKVYVTSQSSTGKAKKGKTITIYVPRRGITIQGVWLDMNSVGGLDVDIEFKNTSGKTIKYITFGTYYKNAVEDPVYCTIRDTDHIDLNYTGPVSNGGSDTPHWDAVIYNWDTNQLHFEDIEIEYTDGTSQTMYCNYYWYEN